MKPGRPFTEDELHAYVDDALPPDRRAEAAAYLTAHPDVAARVDGYRRQRDALRAALEPIIAEPVPTRLSPTHILARGRRSFPGWRMGAGIAASLLVGGAGGWALHGELAPPSRGVGALAREGASSYRVYAADRTRPVELPAEERAQLVHWLSERIGAPTSAPDLSDAGFNFVGGRLVATPHGPAAFFLYQDAAGRRLAVLTRPMEVDQSAAMREHAEGDLSGVAWADDGMGYSLVGPAGGRTLRAIAEQVRQQANRT